MVSKRVSIDEYLASRGYGGVERKAFARDNGVILKGVRGVEEKAGYDKDKGTIRFVMSAEVEDRDRDIVIQAGLDTAEFEKNPVAPWAHRSGNTPIGQWSDVQKVLTGRPKRTEGTLTLTLGDPQADVVALHLAAGSIRSCSIGFMPTSIERREVPDDKKDGYFWPGYIIHEAELYECSPCSVPANPAALAKSAADGDTLSRELIERVLDTWDIKDGLLVPRKAFEDAHRDANGDRTTIVIAGAAYRLPETKEVGKPLVLEPIDIAEPTDGERLAASLEQDTPEAKGLLARFAKLFAPAQPEPVQKQTGPADEFAALRVKHDLLEADAALASLDDEMGRHVPA